MNHQPHNYLSRAVVITVFALLSAVVLVLSACGHNPRNNDDKREEVSVGEQFVDKWKIVKYYQSGLENGEESYDSHVNAGDVFRIVRNSDLEKPNSFRVLPAKGSNWGDRGVDWGELDFNYNPGITTNEPVPLIAEICGSKQCSGESTNGTVNANVQNDFLNLVGRGLEFLESTPIKFNGEDHVIHIFHVRLIDSISIDVLMFFCHQNNCNHNGAAHGRREP